MKYIRKLPPPQSFIDWYNANNDYLQATCSTGEEIWLRLDRTVKKGLNDELLREQGHICAYCGTRIGKKELLITGMSEEELLTFCVEHFLRKGDENYKRFTLEYSNLLGCCKISQQEGKLQTIPFPIEGQPHLKTLSDIADYFNVTIEHLKKNSRILRKIDGNDDLDAINNRKPEGHKIVISYKDNIHHCDDTKFNRTEDIVNPTTEEDCERYFRYTQRVNRKNEPICEIYGRNIRDNRVNKTIEILNLNANNLCKDRVTAYEAGIKFADDLMLILESNEDMSDEDFKSHIRGTLEDIYAKTEGKLDPFCFVTASVVWNSFL